MAASWAARSRWTVTPGTRWTRTVRSGSSTRRARPNVASLVLGLDVGTTGTKAVLADPLKGVVAVASQPTALSSPHPGWAEAQPTQWWSNVCALVPQVLGEAGVTAAAVGGVSAPRTVPPGLPV